MQDAATPNSHSRLATERPAGAGRRSGSPSQGRPWVAVWRRKNNPWSCAKDFVSYLPARDAEALRRISGYLVPQCPDRDAKKARRYRSVPLGMRERFQNQIPFDVSQGRAYQPPGETAARGRGNRSVRGHAHCATPVNNARRAHHQKTTRGLIIP